MPVIPAYRPRYTIPGESGNAQQDVGSAGVVGNAIAQFGKTGMAATEDISNILIQRDQKLKAQADTNLAAQKGNDFDNDWLDASVEIKKQYQGNDAAAVMDLTREYFRTARERFAVPDNEKVNSNVQRHLLVRESQSLTAMAAYQAEQIAQAATNTRAYSLETSEKEAQTLPDTNLSSAKQSYVNTLEAQKANGSISQEKYNLLKLEGISRINTAALISENAYNPVGALAKFKLLKQDKESFTAEAHKLLTDKLEVSAERRISMDAATEVFKSNPGATTEAMEDQLKARKDLTPVGLEQSISQLRGMVAVRHADQERDRVNYSNQMYAQLAGRARERGGPEGINLPSDIRDDQFATWVQKDPVAAQKWQDNTRREQDYLSNQVKAETRAVEAEKRNKRVEAAAIRQEALQAQQEKRYQQTENAARLSMDSDALKKANLEYLAGAGDISWSQAKDLAKEQAKIDPIRSEKFKQAYSILKKANIVKTFDKDPLKAQARSSEYIGLLQAYTKNHGDDADYDPVKFTNDELLKPAATGIIENVLSFMGISGKPMETEKNADLREKAGPPAASITKIINGKSYIKQNGKWFEQ